MAALTELFVQSCAFSRHVRVDWRQYAGRPLRRFEFLDEVFFHHELIGNIDRGRIAEECAIEVDSGEHAGDFDNIAS